MSTPKQKIQLAFSPCPNDTFMFDAMIHGKIDTEGLEFNVELHDIETLNKKALQSVFDVSKISFFAFTSVAEQYQLLTSGSALGTNCGPLLISKKEIKLSDLKNKIIAIPGKNTTAHFLLNTAFPEVLHKKEMIFSAIEQAVLTEIVDAGVIIHENRFTYQDKGLLKLLDLGEYWEKTTGLPIPLGGIAVRRSLPLDLKQKINRIMRESVLYALSHPSEVSDFIKMNAQEMDEDVIQQHINLYVNSYSVDLGEKGKQAVYRMFESYFEHKKILLNTSQLFIDE
ncbi:MAG TPA: 1,4-dihydroxy-6-naphthoate synthase [Bacteroidales bacterium]|nr:1,4-dihydroxy-6-naphthoate synthase [Bacteroidales bacterium]HQI46063.1 1,4-dihydroxy-6-naphthoate synthase [Bacteroidales bacterium]